MIPVPGGVKVWLATGHTDMRKGFPGLSLMVQETLKRDPMCGHLFVFRNRSSQRVKILWWDQDGYAIYYKRLERGTFQFPCVGGKSIAIGSEQLKRLLSGCAIE